MNYISPLVSLILTIQLVLLLRRLAPGLGLLDRPGGRKAHEGAVPLVGGLAMFFGFAFSILLLDTGLGTLKGFLAGSALLVLIGVLDDLKELSSTVRFVVQVIAALFMIHWGDVGLVDLGHLLVPGSLVELGWFAVPLTVFSVVGVINAMNMVDGVDGLAGSLSALATLILLGLAVIAGKSLDVMILGVLLAAIVGFLLFNLRLPWQPRATVFMGDAGSMFLGFTLAWFLIKFAQGDNRVISPVVALWLLGIPLIDTVTMMLRRILRGRSPFSPDREHFHHILLLAGFSPGVTLGIMVAISALMAAIGLAGHYFGVPESVLFYLFLAAFGGYFWTIRRAWRVMRFLRCSLNRRAPRDRRFGSERRRENIAVSKENERRSGGPERRHVDRRANRGNDA